MADAAQTSQANHGLRRRWLPVATLVVWGVIVGVLWSLPPDSFERGMRIMFTFLASVAAAVLLAVWFFGLSGAAWRTRGLGAIALVVLVAGAAASVRRVDFSGDMEPAFDFRWQPSRESLLEAYLDREAERPLPLVVEGEPSRVVRRVTPEDMPHYRGANWTGIVSGPRLARSWAERAPQCLWRHPCGEGYASFAVVGDLAVTIEQRGDNEVVVCYDVPTGRQYWTHAYRALFSERLGGDGPRATPTIYHSRVYSLGATGELVKLDLAAGYLIWKLNILAENGSQNLDWGMSGSPLVDDGRVVVNPGAQQGTSDSADILAIDAEQGTVVMRGGKAKASYASPMLVTLAAREQILIFDAAGLAGFDPESGAELWRFAWTSDFDINAAQPVVLDQDHVLVTSATGCALVHVSVEGETWKTGEVWRNRSMKSSYSNPIVYQGHLYGLDDGILACLDVATGDRLWKRGRYGHGQMLLADDLLLVLSEKGELALVEATPDEFRELGRIQAIDGKTWNNPVLINGRVLVRNHLEMACYDLPLE